MENMKNSIRAGIIFLAAILVFQFSAGTSQAFLLQNSSFQPASSVFDPKEGDTGGYYNAEESDSGASIQSFFNLGTAHKLFGYSAIAAGLVAMGTGIGIKNDYQNDRTPSQSLRGLHSGSSFAAAGLAVAACTTGFIAYHDLLSFENGINTYNTHILLATLSTIGFLVSLASAPEAEGSVILESDEYSHHCTVAQVSGAMMFLSVLVIQF